MQCETMMKVLKGMLSIYVIYATFSFWFQTFISFLRSWNFTVLDLNSWSTILFTNLLSILMGLTIRYILSQYYATNRPAFEKGGKKLESQNISRARTASGNEMTEEKRQRVNIIKSVPLFSSMSMGKIIQLSLSLKHEVFLAGEALMVENEKGDKFYIISEGVCEVSVSEKIVGTLVKGDYCGEQALMSSDSKRNATVKAKYQTKCLSLDRDNFQLIFDENHRIFPKRGAIRDTISDRLEDVFIDKRKITKKTPQQITWLLRSIAGNLLFDSYSEEQLEEVVGLMVLKDVQDSELLIKQGDVGNMFYVIEKGTFSVFIDDIKVKMLDRGKCFGELALVYNDPRTATVTAVKDAKVWCLHRLHFRKILMQHSKKESAENMRFLRNIPVFASLLNFEMQALDQALVTKVYKKGDVIFDQGSKGDSCWIVKMGEVVIQENVEGGWQEKIRLKSGAFFGEEAFLKTDYVRTLRACCATDVTAKELSRYDFRLILGPLENIISRKVEMRQKSLSKDTTNDKATMNWPKKSELKTIRTLGRGAFGLVTLVIDEKKCVYALKKISKYKIVQSRLEIQVVREKEVMQKLDSKFLVSLKGTYKDSYAVYFLLQPCLGGEIHAILKKSGSFNESTAQFYSGSVIEGLIHIHGRGIIYRDLKTENLVLEETGYLCITDFGLAKFMDGRTFTFCGTPEYLSPETITGNGYGFAVDWWALGVLIFELVTGYTPFVGNSVSGILKKIMAGDIRFPKVISPECKNIVNRLLQHQPSKRLGVTYGGPEAIKNESWFTEFNWESLNSRNMEVPSKPPAKSNDDSENSEEPEDDDSEEEEMDFSRFDMSWTENF